MGRPKRADKTGGDYQAFERILAEVLERCDLHLYSCRLPPNHWHFLLWPEGDKDLPAFMQRLTNTHVQRWQRNRRRVGQGHVYQGRYKSFPVQEDDHFFQVLRYVERNALRANLVERAEDWKWSSIGAGKSTEEDERWPLVRPLPCGQEWTAHVNTPQTQAERKAIRVAVKRGRPYGSETWMSETVGELGLKSTLRGRGRPRKQPDK